MPEDFRVAFNGREFPCVDKGFERDAPVHVVIRPEDVRVAEPGNGGIRGRVVSVVFKGVHYEMLVKEDSRTWVVQNTKSRPVGSEVEISFGPEDIHVMRSEGGE